MANRAGDTDTDEFSWAPLGEPRWRELAQSAGASELQLRFAVAKFSGASATAAARIAGYSGNPDALRRAGYAAARSTAVANLLELAAINSPVDAKITDKELDAKIAKMVRSPDSNVSIKAIELHAKREAQRKAESEAQKPISREGELANLEKTFPELAARIRLVEEGRQHDHLLLPDGRTVGQIPEAELYPAFAKLGIPGLHPQLARPALLELFAAEVGKIKNEGANRAVDEWLSRKRTEFANAI
jgi:hypothetical protein